MDTIDDRRQNFKSILVPNLNSDSCQGCPFWFRLESYWRAILYSLYTLLKPCPDLECPRHSICLGDENDDWACLCIQGFEMVDSKCLDIGMNLTYGLLRCYSKIKMNANGKTSAQKLQNVWTLKEPLFVIVAKSGIHILPSMDSSGEEQRLLRFYRSQHSSDRADGRHEF